MTRAAILIGVKKTGGLPQLNATSDGVRLMREWALAQGMMDCPDGQPMKQGLVKMILDDHGPVDVGTIKRAVKEVVDTGAVEQLVIYFSGHGVNIRSNEFWLLSDAPQDPQAAVNVVGSVTLARQCVIPHVVLISDCCRTAADSIEAQNVTGSEIFPNMANRGRSKSVDLFYACVTGAPSLEIRDPNDSSRLYRAVYTEVLCEALAGKELSLLEPADMKERYVRPEPLQEYLWTTVPKRLLEKGVPADKTQEPDAIITSRNDAWLSKVIVRVTRGGVGTRGGKLPHPEPKSHPTLLTVSREMLHDTLSDKHQDTPRNMSATILEALDGGSPETEMFIGAHQRAAESFNTEHFETGSGFKVRGAKVVEAFSLRVVCELLDTNGELVRINNPITPATNVLLVFEEGNGVLLPAIPEFVTGLTFDGGELENVTYEPSDLPLTQSGADRRRYFDSRKDEIRELRAVIAASARMGVFRLMRGDADILARRMRYAKGPDPSLALYAAYAFNDLNQFEQIQSMNSYQLDELHLQFFDTALLAESLGVGWVKPGSNVFPLFPMLSQGWALLGAYGVTLPPSLTGIERQLVPSLWTLFDPTGVEMIRAAMYNREVM